MLAKTPETKLEASYRLCAWEEVLRLLTSFPAEVEEELKKEGDVVYG